MLEQGDAAPNAPYATVDGSKASIAGHKGRKLVLYFYPKDDTTGCTREAQDFTALAGEFAKAGADLVGISKDSVKSHAKFIGKYDLKVALGSDERGAGPINLHVRRDAGFKPIGRHAGTAAILCIVTATHRVSEHRNARCFGQANRLS